MNRSIGETSEHEEDSGYHADIAMQLLLEIEELNDEIAKCSESLENEKRIQQLLTSVLLQIEEDCDGFSVELVKKNDEIKRLKAKLNMKNNMDATNLRTNHVNPDEITLKIRFVLQQIQIDHHSYQETGKFENINERINEVRGVFNLLLKQLYDLNSQNKLVTRTLDGLKKLDVS